MCVEFVAGMWRPLFVSVISNDELERFRRSNNRQAFSVGQAEEN